MGVRKRLARLARISRLCRVDDRGSGAASDPGLTLLQSATLWLDASDAHAVSGVQYLRNKGTGGRALDARFGSTGQAQIIGGALKTFSGTNYATLTGPAYAAVTSVQFEIDLQSTDLTGVAGNNGIFEYGNTAGNDMFFATITSGGSVAFAVAFRGGGSANTNTGAALVAGERARLRFTMSLGGGLLQKDIDKWNGTAWTSLISSSQITAVTDFAASSPSPSSVIGGSPIIAGRPFNGTIFSFKATIGGSLAVNADFSTAANLASSFVCATGQTVTINSTSGVDTNDPLLLTHSGTNYLYLPGLSSNACTIPDAAALRVTGDIDIKVRVALADWTPSSRQALTAKRGAAGSNYHHSFCVSTGGAFYFEYGDSSTTVVSATSSVANSLTDGTTYWVRVTRSSSTGDVKFYTAADSASVPSSWTQLGTTQATAAGSIYAGTDSLCLGGWHAASLSNQMLAGMLYRALVQSGIDGTTVFDADFTANTNQSSFTESSANAATVTINRATSGRKAVMVVRPTLLFGTDDYLEVPDNDLLDFNAENFTVMAVVRVNPNVPADARVVSKRAGTSPNYGWELVGSNTASLADFYGMMDTSSGNTPTSPGTAADIDPVALQRSLIGFVVDDSAGTLNGFLGSTLAPSRSLLANRDTRTATPLSVGRFVSGSGYFDGEIEHVAVFRSALTSTELGQIMTTLGVS